MECRLQVGYDYDRIWQMNEKKNQVKHEGKKIEGGWLDKLPDSVTQNTKTWNIAQLITHYSTMKNEICTKRNKVKENEHLTFSIPKTSVLMEWNLVGKSYHSVFWLVFEVT